jgi:hypothetical protein
VLPLTEVQERKPSFVLTKKHAVDTLISAIDLAVETFAFFMV